MNEPSSPEEALNKAAVRVRNAIWQGGGPEWHAALRLLEIAFREIAEHVEHARK
jgi:hypothetical protein